MSAREWFVTAFYKMWPSWLTTGEGELVLASLALLIDDYGERAYAGLRAHFPGYAPPDALPKIGRDRILVRGIDEPAEAYAERLTGALDDLRTRGSPFALLRQLRHYLQADCVVRTVDRRGNWFTIAADGTESYVQGALNWDWDGEPLTSWSRFWVIIYPVDGTDPWAVSGDVGDATLWGDGLVGNAGRTVGTTATPSQVAAVRAIVREWKPAGTTCEWIIIAFDDATFTPAGATDPSGDWGTWGNHSGSAVRLASARYWKGA